MYLHSSSLDLQPLYGYSKTTADATREWSGGKLKAFAEERTRAAPRVVSMEAFCFTACQFARRTA